MIYIWLFLTATVIIWSHYFNNVCTMPLKQMIPQQIFYVIKFISEAYKKTNYTQIDRQVISNGELVVKVQYL